MNVCVENHIPKFQVTYKPAKNHTYTPVWLVCDACLQNKSCFGAESDIEKVELLA